MSRFLLLALLLIPVAVWCDTVYRTTDAHGNVVFTDTPPPAGTSTERIEIRNTNTAEPPAQPLPAETDTQTVNSAVPTHTVTITDPPTETSYPMGPGNFSVRVEVNPSLGSEQKLQLFMDGKPWGDPQQATTWDLTNVFRGQHDLTVGVVVDSGETLALSTPVRVYVHRPSTNFKNRQPPPKPPKPPKPTPHPTTQAK